MSDATRAAETTGRRDLTAIERELLRIEAQAWGRLGAKEQAIYEATGLSPTRAYQLVNGLLTLPAAWEQHPTIVRTIEYRQCRYSRSRTTRLTTRA